MKPFFAILLLVLTLCTILAPCADGVVMVLEKCSAELEAGCCQVPAEKAHGDSGCGSQSSESTGHCSPLCHCACCGQVAAIQLLSYPVRQEMADAHHQPAYAAAYDFDFTHHIWQPPRQG